MRIFMSGMYSSQTLFRKKAKVNPKSKLHVDENDKGMSVLSEVCSQTEAVLFVANIQCTTVYDYSDCFTLFVVMCARQTVKCSITGLPYLRRMLLMPSNWLLN